MEMKAVVCLGIWLLPSVRFLGFGCRHQSGLASLKHENSSHQKEFLFGSFLVFSFSGRFQFSSLHAVFWDPGYLRLLSVVQVRAMVYGVWRSSCYWKQAGLWWCWAVMAPGCGWVKTGYASSSPLRLPSLFCTDGLSCIMLSLERESTLSSVSRRNSYAFSRA